MIKLREQVALRGCLIVPRAAVRRAARLRDGRLVIGPVEVYPLFMLQTPRGVRVWHPTPDSRSFSNGICTTARLGPTDVRQVRQPPLVARAFRFVATGTQRGYDGVMWSSRSDNTPPGCTRDGEDVDLMLWITDLVECASQGVLAVGIKQNAQVDRGGASPRHASSQRRVTLCESAQRSARGIAMRPKGLGTKKGTWRAGGATPDRFCIFSQARGMNATGTVNPGMRPRLGHEDIIVRPLEDFFSQYPNFQSEPLNSPVVEFNRLCVDYGWERNDPKKRAAHKAFQFAMKKEFDSLYGSDEKDIHNWYKLCNVLRIDPVPDTLQKCRSAVLEKHVNLVDLVHGSKERVRVFKTEKNLEDAMDGGVLRALRRHILVPREGTVTSYFQEVWNVMKIHKRMDGDSTMHGRVPKYWCRRDDLGGWEDARRPLDRGPGLQKLVGVLSGLYRACVSSRKCATRDIVCGEDGEEKDIDRAVIHGTQRLRHSHRTRRRQVSESGTPYLCPESLKLPPRTMVRFVERYGN
ncbi:hypothetical protein EDB85DRAFT_1894554 [Lactarius pseudohatsudake]|nr:hypothetical protein EDB85DRAFT_1894554 [Lactarius pseudohatsudake]